MSSKVVIVTGASRGIGLAITKWLIKHSHKVVMVSRSEQALRAIKDDYPSQAVYIAADLTDLAVRNPATAGIPVSAACFPETYRCRCTQYRLQYTDIP